MFAQMTTVPSVALLGFIAMCFVPSLAGAAFRPGDWYESLRKPAWRPPNWVFAPIWTTLYLIIGISGWLVWEVAGFAGAKLAFAVYGVQLVFNAIWSPLFFGLRRPDLSLLDIGALWLSIAATMALFYPIHHGAALLLLPYLAWVSIASVLNFSIWRLNPQE